MIRGFDSIVKIKRFEPAVDRRVLILLSGLTWSIVGIALCRMAVLWLSPVNSWEGVLLGLSGIVLGLAIHLFGFSKLVAKNVDRIRSKKNKKICIFAFQAWKSYLIVAIMIGLGIILRSSPLPKKYLAVIYIGFGGAMVLSSIKYYMVFLKSDV